LIQERDRILHTIYYGSNLIWFVCF